MRLDHLRRIHSVHVIGTEHDDVLRLFVEDQVQRLVDRVGAARVPPRTETLLRRNGRDVLAMKS
ncbi:Uncharacterised protein [Mycobacteroides abscessus subsp. abscessus]|nr:Uncharacterised protein [Mycobacteroides abscessus subsp. abscessus]